MSNINDLVKDTEKYSLTNINDNANVKTNDVYCLKKPNY